MTDLSPPEPAPPVPASVIATSLVVGVLAVSSSAILVRVAEAPSLAIAFWRTFGGAAVLAPWGVRWLRRHGLAAGMRRELLWSGVALAVHFALFIGSLSYTTVASSVTLATMSPIFVGLGATLFLGEPPTRRTWAGMAVTVTGAIVIGLGDLADLDLGPRALLGDAMALASAFAVAIYLLIGRRTRAHIPVTVYGTVVYGTAAAVLLVASVATQASLWGYEATTWWALLGILIGPQLLGHTVFNSLLGSVTATIVAIVVLAEPVGATLLAYAFLDETPAALFWVGAPLILVGVTIASVRSRRVRSTT